MTTTPPTRARLRRAAASRRSVLPALAAGGAVGMLILGLVSEVTSASFVRTAQASAALSAEIDVAQSADGTAQYSDSAAPNVVVTPTTTDPVAAFDAAPGNDPQLRTATFAVTIYIPSGMAAVNLFLAPYDRGSTIYGNLLFGFSSGGKTIMPGGTPLAAAPIVQANGGAGIAVPGSFAGGQSAVLLVKVWLAADTPRSAFDADLSTGFAVTGRSAAGADFTVSGSVS